MDKWNTLLMSCLLSSWGNCTTFCSEGLMSVPKDDSCRVRLSKYFRCLALWAHTAGLQCWTRWFPLLLCHWECDRGEIRCMESCCHLASLRKNVLIQQSAVPFYVVPNASLRHGNEGQNKQIWPWITRESCIQHWQSNMVTLFGLNHMICSSCMHANSMPLSKWGLRSWRSMGSMPPPYNIKWGWCWC